MPGKRVLMVEGQDDEHVVKHICGERRLGIIETIHRYGGKAPLIDGIGVRLKESDITALGILIDADTDLQSCWQAVTNRLRQAGYKEIPALPAPEGTVILAPSDSLLPRVGIWLMPDNRLPGILEDFLTFLVPPADPLFAHVERSIDQIPPGQRRFDDLKQPKARIHTWLAWQQEPGVTVHGAETCHRLTSSGFSPGCGNPDIRAQERSPGEGRVDDEPELGSLRAAGIAESRGSRCRWCRPKRA